MATLEVLNASLAVTATVTHPMEVRCTDRMSAVGEMVFTLYEGSGGASAIVPGGFVRWIDGSYGFLGVVEAINAARQDDGYVVLTVRCADIARELSWETAGPRALGGPSGATITVTAAIATLLGTYWPSLGWTVPTGGGVGSLTIYLAADGASNYTTLLSIADKVGAWLVRTGGATRQLTMTSAWTASGITARSVTGDKPANVAALLALSSEQVATDLVTRVYPFTAGNAEVRVGLEMASVWPGGDYVMDSRLWGTNTWWFVYDAVATAAYGNRERVLQFPDISPLSNSKPDIQAAANALLAATLNWLKQQAKVKNLYTLTVDDSPAPIVPGQSLTVQHGALNATLYCVESTHTWAPNAPLRSSLRVTDGGQWPLSGADETVRAMEAARVYRAHAQLSANVYQLSFNKPVDAQYGAEFRFRFDEGITQVLMAALDVKLAPLQSTVRAIGAGVTKTSAYTYAGHSHYLRLAAHQHWMGAHAHTYDHTLPAHTHPIPIDVITVSDTRHALVNMTPVPKRFQVDSIPSSGTTVHTQADSAGSGATGSANTGTLPASTVATADGLTVTTDNGSYTAASAGGFTHDHTVDLTVTMEYGIFRDSSANQFATADLEYRINSGAWLALTGATALGDGWLRIALTNAIVDSQTFTPVSKSNTVTVRAVAISAAQETYVTGGTPSGIFNRWDDGGAYVQQISGTAAQGLALSPNGWLYLLRKSTGLVEVYAPNTAGTLALYDTWTSAAATYNAITVDARTGGKWMAGDGGQVWGFGLGQKFIAGSPALTAVAALGGNVYVSGGTSIYRVNMNVSGAPVTSVTPASGAGLPIALLSDGRLVQISSNAAAFLFRVFEADLTGAVTLTRSDAGNAWTPLSMAISANLAHVGCSDGRVRTYSLDPEAGTAALVWTSTGTPGATGYPSATSLLGVSSVLSSKAAMIDAQLTVRSVVQAIVMN